MFKSVTGLFCGIDTSSSLDDLECKHANRTGVHFATDTQRNTRTLTNTTHTNQHSHAQTHTVTLCTSVMQPVRRNSGFEVIGEYCQLTNVKA